MANGRGPATQESITTSKFTQPPSEKSGGSKPKIHRPVGPLMPNLISTTTTKMNVHEQIQTLEKNIKTLMFSDDPKNKDYIWPLVQELSILLNGLAVKMIQKQKFEKAETYLLKAKQVSEALNSKFSRNWPKIKEWLLIRLALYQNFALIYKAQKQYRKGYDLLSEFARILKIEVLVDRTEIIMAGGYETFFINLAHFCKKLELYEESLSYCDKTIEFMHSILRNNGLMKQISEEIKREKQSFESFLTRKNALLASLFYMKGKILKKQNKDDLALDVFNNGYRLVSENLGENNDKTLKYKAKYEELRNKMTFLQEMGKNSDVKDFNSFKQEIEASKVEKAGISSISELDENNASFLKTENLEQQPLQIQRSMDKKTTANFFISTNMLAKKFGGEESTTFMNQTKAKSPKVSLARPKIPVTGLFEEKDEKFSDLLKNSRIIYPRRRSPMPDSLQLSFDLKNSSKVTRAKPFARSTSKSKSKSKSPSPNQKNPSLLSGLANHSIKSTLINSSAFYNKLRVNSQKTKALQQATISRFLNNKTPAKPNNLTRSTPERIRPFTGKPNERTKDKTDINFIKEFPSMRNNEYSLLLQQTKLQMILNQRPKTPVKFFRSPTPEIQIFQVQNPNGKQENAKQQENDIHETTLLEENMMQQFIQRRIKKSNSQIKPPPTELPQNIMVYSTESPKSPLLAKRHTLTVNVLNNFAKKSLPTATSAISKSKRFSVVESNSTLLPKEGSPAIKTLASITESLGKTNNNNDSKAMSKNDSSMESNSQVSLNAIRDVDRERKNSAFTRKMTTSDAFDEKSSLGLNRVMIPRLSRDRGGFRETNSTKNTLTPQGRTTKEGSHQMTFQHVKHDMKQLKTIKSLDINQVVMNKVQNSTSTANMPTPSSPKNSLRKSVTKKSISLAGDKRPKLRSIKTQEISGGGQSEDTFNGGTDIIKDTTNINNNGEVSILDELKRNQQVLNDSPNAGESKMEMAAQFIQKTFRKILKRKLLYVKNMMSDARYLQLNEQNRKLAEEIESRLSKLRVKEVISLLRSAKSMVSYMTFQEILALEQFPLRFYSSFLNGFGPKSVFWLLDNCILREEFKLVMTDPNQFNSNDEWHYHDSFTVTLNLRNSIGRDLRLEFKTKERLCIQKTTFRYIWKVLNVIIDEWFKKEGYYEHYVAFLEERGAKDHENKQILVFYRIHEKKMTEKDRIELWGFRDRLIFLIEKKAFLVRKMIGHSWKFQGFIKESLNYSSLNIERFNLINERSMIRRYLACRVVWNFGVFLSKYGLETVIKNEDPTSDIKLFYENFEPWLKDNTFQVMQKRLKTIFRAKA